MGDCVKVNEASYTNQIKAVSVVLDGLVENRCSESNERLSPLTPITSNALASYPQVLFDTKIIGDYPKLTLWRLYYFFKQNSLKKSAMLLTSQVVCSIFLFDNLSIDSSGNVDRI